LVDGNYQARREEIQSAIQGSDSSIALIPIEMCLGLSHLEKKLDEVTERNGIVILSFIS
jgi:hypothetical protein